MKLVPRLRGLRLERDLRHNSAFYARPWSTSEIEQKQLVLLNREWLRVTLDSPYYGELRKAHALPEQFRSLRHFAEQVPRTDKQTVQESGQRIRCRSKPPDLTLMTGGSTASPMQLPAWKGERRAIALDQWTGRGWYDIRPESRLFLIWGHSHLLGTGLRGWINGRLRAMQDRLLGYHRFSAYDLQPKAMREAGEAMIRFGPEYVMGYSVALDRFARANQDRRDGLRALGLKAVIATAESFPAEDSAMLLRTLFGCPVVMEYGAVESGVIGYTVPDGGYRAFWRSHFLEAVHAGDGRYELLVTSLRPRCFPLVRYAIGDEIELGGDGGRHRIGLAGFDRVIGRCNDYVPLADGTTIHSEVFTHAVRACPAVRGYQVVHGAGEVRLDYLSDAELDRRDREAIAARLAKVHPDLAGLRFRRVRQLATTLAGKTRMVIREEP